MIGLDGCMVGPDYERPDFIVPDAWHAQVLEDMKTTEEGPGKWWASFDDPVLVELIERTDRNNLDLRTMIARIDAARATYGVAAADLFPQVEGGGQAVWYRAEGGVSPVSGVFDPSGSTFSMGFDMSWELDLWGRVRRTMEARQLDLLAAIENWRDTLITVRAEVASTYINYRTYRARAELNELAIAATRVAVELAEQEYAEGTGTLADFLMSRSQLRTIESDLPMTESDAQQSLNQLALLLGEAPGNLAGLIDSAGRIPVPSPSIAVGMPADVIRQRPDIRSAERELASAVSEIGATEALLLPQFKLAGGVGFESSSESELFLWSNRNWSIGPSFTWSLLNWGSVESQIRIQEALTQEALISYEEAILSAYQDMENALVGFASTELARRDSAAARDDSLGALVLSLESYDAGTVDMQEVIQIELQILDAEYALLNYQGQLAQAAVTLYKAAGGDWTPVFPGSDGPVPVHSDPDSITSTRAGEPS